VEAVLLAIALHRATTESEVPSVAIARPPASAGTEQPISALEHLLREALERRLRPQPPLLTGDAVMAILGLPPGPEVGHYLQEIEESRADGRLQTGEEAREWLRRRPRSSGGTLS
jgi:poly(A) polymerase